MLHVQVHAEECERLASEAALARARASSAARSDAAAAAAGAAEQGARDALAVSQRDAAVLYDQWRLRCVTTHRACSEFWWPCMRTKKVNDD